MNPEAWKYSSQPNVLRSESHVFYRHPEGKSSIHSWGQFAPPNLFSRKLCFGDYFIERK